MGSNENSESRRERIRRVVQSRNGCSARFDTSDIIQETEIQLWLNGHDDLNDTTSSVDQALIATMAKGHLAKKIRSHRASKRDASRDSPIVESLQSRDFDPSEQASNKEQKGRIIACIKKLDATCQEIVFLRYYCGMTLVEIQEELGLTKQQLSTHCARAARQLRKLFCMQEAPLP